MRATSTAALAGCLLATGGLTPPARLPAAEPITPGSFARLHALVKPSGGEDRWAAVPWLTSLWQARQVAAREGKPILLWEMDGHPLGCT
jgi:hypothetical protein